MKEEKRLSLSTRKLIFISLQKFFFDLYKTLSEIAHTHGLNYERDVLPIPDVDESNFKKVNAIALGK